jgi:hypothetical protein
MSGLGIIMQEPDQFCELCGKLDECRPYGANDEQICFDCATRDDESKAIAERKMKAYIFGDVDVST